MNFFKKLFLKHCIIEEFRSGFVSPDERYYNNKTLTCTNCGFIYCVFVKKGIYFKYAITNSKCPNCGCKPDREIK